VEFVRNNLLLILVAFASGAMLLWPYVRRASGGPWVSTGQATLLINREDALPIDVRDAGEFSAGHILGARHLPVAAVEQGAADLAKKKDRPLIVYCDGGNRCAKASAALKAQGFTRVATLSGGIGAWQGAGLPIEK
jgi:rhodanese-related sulfurtransferase